MIFQDGVTLWNVAAGKNSKSNPIGAGSSAPPVRHNHMPNGLYATIVQLGSSLAPDENLRAICPKCWGGQSREKSFSITRVPMGLVYKCFRAKCGLEGLVGDAAPSTHPSPKRKAKEPYKGKLINIPGGLFARFFLKYQLELEDVERQGIKFAPELGRLYFPIYDYRGYTVGETLRAVSPSQKPKALINKFSDNVCFLHTPLGAILGTRLVLVEDMTSAIKLNKIAPCMALLGTNLSDGCLSIMKQIGIKTVSLMLDGDDAGLTASLKLQQRLNPFFMTTSIIIPQGHDPKDLDYNEMRALL